MHELIRSRFPTLTATWPRHLLLTVVMIVALGLPREVVEQQGDVETARTLVEGVKNEPALWLWYLSDEPGHREEGEKVTSNLKKIYTMIKEVDPNHPVVICGTRAEFYSVNNAENEDVLRANTYPIPDGP